MERLKDYIADAEKQKVAIGHFNVSDLAGLKAIFESVKELKLPVIIGVSEGERDFIGVKQIAVLVKSLREEYSANDGGYPIFLNADHTHSLGKIKEAVEAGFDAVLFDAGKLPLEENIRQTKEAVDYVKNVNPEILVEGELGYIGGSSTLLEFIPEGVAIKPEDLTKTEDVIQFVKETKVDLLAPAVGNIHGMFKNASNPDLNIERIREIKSAAGVPLVLHGGSGIESRNLSAAIDAGISIIHISTELRIAWRDAIKKALNDNPKEITPYKLLLTVINEVQKVVSAKLKLFNNL